MTITLFCCYRSHTALFPSNSLSFSPFLSITVSLSLLLPLYSFKVTTSLRRRQCSYRRKTMRALALCLGEPKVSLFSKIHHIFLCLYRFLGLICFLSLFLSFFPSLIFKPMFLLSVSTHAHPFCLMLLSSDSHRGVHSNASIPCAAVPGVCR